MLKGKVSIVTGSAAGIGAASAAKLAELGSNVVINYSKSKDEAEQVAAQCADIGVEVEIVAANVADDEACQKMAATAMDRWGRIDILVNNAGTTKFANHAKLEELDKTDFHDIYDVNVVGAYQMVRAVVPAMRQQYEASGEAGSIVNISSIAGVAGIGSSIAYAASKGAFNTMTLSLARSLAPAVRVNAICPGFVGTRWFRDRFGEERFQGIVKNQIETTPLKLASMAEDIANTVQFFAGAWSRNVTGETLMVDAGAHLNFTPLVAR